MATHNLRYGWEWTDEERHARQDALRRARRLYENVREQTRRVSLYVPQFKERADAAHKHLGEGLKTVLNIDLSNRGAKYKSITPDEMDRVLAALPDLMKPWEQFISSPDVVAASRVKNRELRAENAHIREHNKGVKAQYADMMEKFDDVLRKVDEGDVHGSLDAAAKMGIL